MRSAPVLGNLVPRGNPNAAASLFEFGIAALDVLEKARDRREAPRAADDAAV